MKIFIVAPKTITKHRASESSFRYDLAFWNFFLPLQALGQETYFFDTSVLGDNELKSEIEKRKPDLLFCIMTGDTNYCPKEPWDTIIEETNKVYHRVTLGEILQETKITLGTDNYSKDITRSTMLFGDPSMPIPAALFAPAPPPSNPVQGGGGGGCSAAASDGNGSNGPAWPEGILELLMLFAIGWGLRRLQKRFLA